ncbi:MAG: type II secretion system protein N [Candidatus Competibacter sp.]
MKGIVGYGLLGLAAFLLFLVLLAPATLLTDPLGRRLAGFSVQTVEGTATKGMMSGVRWHGFRIERLFWRWRPLALFGGRLEFNLKADDPALKLTGNAAFGLNQQFSFRDLAGRLPLAWFINGAGAAKLPLDGIGEFNVQYLELNEAGQPLAARGTAQLLNLRALLGQPLNLGNYMIQLDSAGGAEGVQGKLKDSDAPLALDGTLSVLAGGRYRLNGQIALRDAGNAALRQALNLLGPSGGDGRWALNFSGALAP